MADKFIVAKNINNAVSLKNSKSAFLAGGTEDNRLDSLVKASSLISIKNLELRFVNKNVKVEGFKGSYIEIGALTTFQDLVECLKVPDYLKTAAMFMSSRQRRNMATLGGNISICRDDSYVISTLLAVDALLSVVSPSKRSSVITLESFVAKRDKYENYLIKSVLVKDSAVSVVSKRYANTASSHGYLTVAVAKSKSYLRVAVSAKNSGNYVFNEGTCGVIKFKDDIFGSKKYKEYLLNVTVSDLLKAVQEVAK